MIYHDTLMMGCDPEFFLESKGKIIGSERIIPEKGISYRSGTAGKTDGLATAKTGSKTNIICDGVQIEFNPAPNTCRANLGNTISACFIELYKKLKDTDIKPNFSQVNKITAKELKELSDKSKIFGCAPSNNSYNDMVNEIKIDPMKYKKRSAGGHIHMGYKPKNHNEFIKLMDIIVGNTCVLIDRDPSNKERRKVYGKAGDYRLPSHGIEYRTLSNFWLQAYPLMSFVFGLSRITYTIHRREDCRIYVDKILKNVKEKHIQRAINNNDFDLAMDNFNKYKWFFNLLNNGAYPESLNDNNLDKFMYFVEHRDNYFKHDIFEHWIKLPEGHGTGWESFLEKLEMK